MATGTGETAGPARAWLPHVRDIAAVAASVLAAAAVLVGGIQYAIAEVDARLQAMEVRFDARFQAMDARFDARFEAMDARIEAMEERLHADIAAMREDVAENRERLIRIETIVNDIRK